MEVQRISHELPHNHLLEFSSRISKSESLAETNPSSEPPPADSKCSQSLISLPQDTTPKPKAIIDSFGQLVSLSSPPSPKNRLESNSSISFETTSSSDSDSETPTISPRELPPLNASSSKSGSDSVSSLELKHTQTSPVDLSTDYSFKDQPEILKDFKRLDPVFPSHLIENITPSLIESCSSPQEKTENPTTKIADQKAPQKKLDEKYLAILREAIRQTDYVDLLRSHQNECKKDQKVYEAYENLLPEAIAFLHTNCDMDERSYEYQRLLSTLRVLDYLRDLRKEAENMAQGISKKPLSESEKIELQNKFQKTLQTVMQEKKLTQFDPETMDGLKVLFEVRLRIEREALSSIKECKQPIYLVELDGEKFWIIPARHVGHNGVPTVSDEAQEIVKNQVSDIYLESEGFFQASQTEKRNAIIEKLNLEIPEGHDLREFDGEVSDKASMMSKSRLDLGTESILMDIAKDHEISLRGFYTFEERQKSWMSLPEYAVLCPKKRDNEKDNDFKKRYNFAVDLMGYAESTCFDASVSHYTGCKQGLAMFEEHMKNKLPV